MESTSKMLKSLENLFVQNGKISGGVHSAKSKKKSVLKTRKSKMYKPSKVKAYVYERRIQVVPSKVTKDDDFVSAFLNMTILPKKSTKQAIVKKTAVARPTKMKTESTMDDMDFIVKSLNKFKVSAKGAKAAKAAIRPKQGTRKSMRAAKRPQRLNPAAPLKGKKKSPSKKSSKNSSKKSSSSSNSMMFF